MKIRPIIFQPEMVRALLAGRKTQTRRIRWPERKDVSKPQREAPLARIMAGDVLYVREGMKLVGDNVLYRADDALVDWRLAPDSYLITNAHAPAIHQPRWASRLTLAVTEVRFEHLTDISEADALAEGVTMVEDFDARTSYEFLWKEINGSNSWREDPEIVVLVFEVHRQNVDEFLRAGAANG